MNSELKSSDVKASDAPRGNPTVLLVLVASLLTFVVWNLPVAHRALWGDDVMILAVLARQQGVDRFFHPIVSPARIFMGTPYALATLFPNPALALQLGDALTRLIGGLLTGVVLRRLFPEKPIVPYLGCCLFICATGDSLTNATMALGYEISAALYVASFAVLLHWWQHGTWPALAAAVALLALSLGMSDVGATPAIAAPFLLLIWIRRSYSRLTLTILAWYLPIAGYLMILVPWLRAGQNYASVALVTMPIKQRLLLGLELFLYNFAPWSWATQRGWFPTPPGPVSLQLEVVMVALAAATFFFGYQRLRLRRGTSVRGPIDGWTVTRVCSAFFAVALASNTAYSFIVFAPQHVRTQLMSSYFVSLGIASLAAARPRWISRLMLPVASVFILLGLCGGVNRQNYYSGYWRRHQEELSSIIETVPRLRPRASLILRIPAQYPYLLATEAEYLARCWTALLYADSSMGDRTFVWSANRGTTCTFLGDGMRCRRASGQTVLLGLPNCVILSYDPPTNRYVLSVSVDPDVKSAEYNPGPNVMAALPSEFARTLLGSSQR